MGHLVCRLRAKSRYQPFYSRYDLIPIINKETFQKDIENLVKIGVLTHVQQSQYGTAIFIIPKKGGNVRLITDYHRLNHKLVRNPYPLPRIDETMQQLGGFQYVTSLDINMGYYNIRIFTASQDMTMIVTVFGNFRYNLLPMVMCNSGDIFQAKLD